MSDEKPIEAGAAKEETRDSRREAMIKLAKGAAYVATAALALLEGTKNALAY